MRVLLMGDAARQLLPILDGTGDVATCVSHILESSVFAGCEGFDWIVSFGYRHKLRSSTLDFYPRRAVNLHTSLLPWNRGAHPNFWSWIDDTPKGVTLHQMDAGFDTGPIIAQREVTLSAETTFADTYAALDAAAVGLFAETWPRIRSGNYATIENPSEAGSRHFVRELRSDWLPHGWDTPIADAVALAQEAREAVA